LALLLEAFGVFGLWSGCNAVLLADLSRALGLCPGPLGAALFAGAACSIATMGGPDELLVGRLPARDLGPAGARRRRGVAAFFAAMALGRLATGLAVARLGNRRALLGAGLMTALGMSLALSTTVPALTVVGFLVVGLGVSGVAPLAYSAGGDLAPGGRVPPCRW
jgi:MFS family permease